MSTFRLSFFEFCQCLGALICFNPMFSLINHHFRRSFKSCRITYTSNNEVDIPVSLLKLLKDESTVTTDFFKFVNRLSQQSRNDINQMSQQSRNDIHQMSQHIHQLSQHIHQLSQQSRNDINQMSQKSEKQLINAIQKTEKLNDEIKGTMKVLIEKEMQISASNNLLQKANSLYFSLCNKMDIRTALEYIRILNPEASIEKPTVSASSKTSSTTKAEDKFLIAIYNSKLFNEKIKAAILKNKLRETEVFTCFSKLFHTSSKPMHGDQIQVRTLCICLKDWESNDQFALAFLFKHFQLPFKFTDEFNSEIPIPYDLEKGGI